MSEHTTDLRDDAVIASIPEAVAAGKAFSREPKPLDQEWPRPVLSQEELLARWARLSAARKREEQWCKAQGLYHQVPEGK